MGATKDVVMGYIEAYNAKDVAAMLAFFDDGCVFENVSGGKVTVRTEGREALEALAKRSGDASAWDEAFHWLWPAAFAVAQLKLQPFLPADVEDVAIEALEELVEKVKEVQVVEELRPLVASIAIIEPSAGSGRHLRKNEARARPKASKPLRSKTGERPIQPLRLRHSARWTSAS